MSCSTHSPKRGDAVVEDDGELVATAAGAGRHGGAEAEPRVGVGRVGELGNTPAAPSRSPSGDMPPRAAGTSPNSDSAE